MRGEIPVASLDSRHYPGAIMALSRRHFLRQAAPLGLTALLPSCGVEGLDRSSASRGTEALSGGAGFLHGVASGDPLADAVILWTRATPMGAELALSPPSGELELEIRWRIARDPELVDVVAEGIERARAAADFTVKVDVTGLEPATTYYYEFSAGSEHSPVGRTRTLPRTGVRHARLAVVSCANYPAGYFNVYRLIAGREDLDLVVHLGDYLYEYGNEVLGDGTPLDRVPEPNRELLTLEEYRARHAQYKRDADLQALHRQHPMIAVWDDHEVANDAFEGGAVNHQPDSEGDWELRKRIALQAYLEWMPVRTGGAGEGSRIYRAFTFGDLFDLIMLDTRFAGRAPALTGNCDSSGLDDAERSVLGETQEQWLLDTLRSSSARGSSWRLVGQQVMFAQLSDAAQGCVMHPDQWDGYPQSRARLLQALAEGTFGNILLLTGDAHASWASDIAKNPFDAAEYDPATGDGSLAVELVTPAVTSPGSAADVSQILQTHPHIKLAETTRRGYLLLDVTGERVQAEWYFVATVEERSAREELGALLQVRDGEPRLVPAEGVAAPKRPGPAPAP